jgi:hypothetical protein
VAALSWALAAVAHGNFRDGTIRITQEKWANRATHALIAQLTVPGGATKQPMSDARHAHTGNEAKNQIANQLLFRHHGVALLDALDGQREHRLHC